MNQNFFIRNYRSSDLNEIYKLFCKTIYSINAKDYNLKQLDAWVGGVNLEAWNKSFLEHYSLVAIDKKTDKIVGFGDADRKEYIDRLYVHKDYQGLGIGTAICDMLEKNLLENKANKIIVHASITAKKFYENRGYIVIKEQQVERKGVSLTNFVMEKSNDKF